MTRTSVVQADLRKLSRELFYLYDWAEQLVYADPVRCVSLTAREVVDLVEDIHGTYEALKGDYKGLLSDHESKSAEPSAEVPRRCTERQQGPLVLVQDRPEPGRGRCCRIRAAVCRPTP
jgi:hypothetical protein